MRCRKRIGRRLASRSPGSGRACERSPAQARAKAALVERMYMHKLAELGPDDGFWSWKSSPHLLWLANQLGGSPR